MWHTSFLEVGHFGKVGLEVREFKLSKDAVETVLHIVYTMDYQYSVLTQPLSLPASILS